MPILVDLHLIVIAILIALAVISVAIHAALRTGSALAWLAATLLVVSAETLVFRYTPHTTLGMAAISVLIPLAYLCAGNAIRQSLRLEIASRKQVTIFGALIALSLLLLAADVPLFYQSIPFQLAGVYIFYEAILIQVRQRYRSLLDNALLILCLCSMTGVAIRAPMFPVLLGRPTPLQYMDVDFFEGVFINALSLLTSGLAILLIAKIVSNVINAHKQQASRDDLTGLLNRRTFDRIAQKFAGKTGVVIMCDIDHFKSVNDRFGHHVGDEVIRTFATILTHFGDYAGRMGGEEFAILLVNTTIEDAVLAAEEIRSEFHAYRHPAMGDASISASFGVAQFDRDTEIKSACQQADKALYEAKRKGRNRICRHHEPSSEQLSLIAEHA